MNFALRTSQYEGVTIVTKKRILESNTNMAQGGIAAVTREGDSFQMHIEDTSKAGCGLSDKRIVEILVKNGPKEIQNLISLGVKFDEEKGKLHLTREAGHQKERILHSSDTTGREIEEALVRNVRANKGIEVLENCFVIDLIVKNGICYGAKVLRVEDRAIFPIFSTLTALATGGIGFLYQNTTNPDIATGDGIAAAFRGGARIEDMEFVQFHPTSLNKPGAPHFLISETFRGEGAKLVNGDGERFMGRYDSSEELALRDIVSRAIFNELKKGPVYLDIRDKGKGFIVNRFPMIYQECRKYGLDITKDPIPISPAAHYICGGIKTNEYGETNIGNLLAFGECACTGVHGANRLASNSLLESVVFSSLGSSKARNLTKRTNMPTSIKEVRICSLNQEESETLRTTLRRAMWDYVGIVRNEKNLNLMLKKSKHLEKRIESSEKNELNIPFLELRNMILVSNLITNAASIRRESRGAHYREDYPRTDDKNWLKHISLERKGKEVKASIGPII